MIIFLIGHCADSSEVPTLTFCIESFFSQVVDTFANPTNYILNRITHKTLETMERHQILILSIAILFGIVHYGCTDGQRDHGEACSLRSQIANFFRESDSPQGCMSSKGLVCVNHKCVCADPSNVYEVVTPDSSVNIPSASDLAGQAGNFLKNLVRGTTTTTPPSTTGASATPGKCVGRAGSPCFTGNSTCVKHASCAGSPRMCKCQGIYSSNAQGYCSKTASVVQQVVKQTVG